MLRTVSVAALLTAGFLAAAPAIAETVNYSADLKGSSETPPTTSKGSGHVKATFDTDTKKLSWTADYTGLTGDAVAAHFHGPAPVGKAAGVMVPITGPLTSPIEGSATLTEPQVKALTSGEMYFNVHTAQNKAGEIRGQLDKGM